MKVGHTLEREVLQLKGCCIKDVPPTPSPKKRKPGWLQDSWKTISFMHHCEREIKKGLEIRPKTCYRDLLGRDKGSRKYRAKRNGIFSHGYLG